ncbi:MAG: ribonuclease HIII [Bacilli bacterium]|nr:ribonuclease HIII [Bacilli bacterium]
MNYSFVLTREQINILIDHYSQFEIFTTNNYTLFRAKIKSSTLSVYTTCKCLIQGNDADYLYNEICDLLHLDHKIEINDKSNEDDNEDIILFKTSIGNDEVGTGDFFGPIVVCSACVNEDNYLIVKRLKVKDSKALNDNKIKEIAPILIENIPYTITILQNEKYNEYIKLKDMNLNRIKAILHNNVMNKFYSKYPEYNDIQIILDDFCTEEKYYEYLSKSNNVVKNIHFETKAENKYLSVACASIIARFYFLREMDKLSNALGIELLKGASKDVDIQTSEIIKNKGTFILNKIAKLNFKNYAKANKILDNQKRTH